MRIFAIALLLAGCGRMGFDPAAQGQDPLDPGADSGSPGVQPSTVGLVTYWSFDNLDTSGAMSMVSSDLASCTAGECPAQALGASGMAAVFDGTNNCMHVPSLQTWTPTQLTMSVWFEVSSAEVGNTQPIITRDPDGCPSPGIVADKAQVGWMFMGDDTTHYHAWSTGLTGDTWHQLAIRFDGTREAVFVDGQCSCDFDPGHAILFATNEFTIGCDDYFNWHAKGSIDEVRIYDRALSDDEMAALVAVAGRQPPATGACAATCPVTLDLAP